MDCIEIDLSPIQTTKDLHSLLSKALNFPDFYGCNWDAFWDSITGLVEMPFILRIYGFDLLYTRLPRDAELLRQCLNNMTVEHPDIECKIEYF